MTVWIAAKVLSKDWSQPGSEGFAGSEGSTPGAGAGPDELDPPPHAEIATPSASVASRARAVFRMVLPQSRASQPRVTKRNYEVAAAGSSEKYLRLRGAAEERARLGSPGAARPRQRGAGSG